VSDDRNCSARLLCCALLVSSSLAACGGGGDMPLGVVAAPNVAPERTIRAETPAATAAILIRRQPAPQDAREGEVVQFEVDAQAPGALRYQWLRNGQPIEGQTGPLLRLRAVADDHLARISVVVRAGGAAQHSEAAVLRIGAP
jgi:hypothetical protein